MSCQIPPPTRPKADMFETTAPSQHKVFYGRTPTGQASAQRSQVTITNADLPRAGCCVGSFCDSDSTHLCLCCVEAVAAPRSTRSASRDCRLGLGSPFSITLTSAAAHGRKRRLAADL